MAARRKNDPSPGPLGRQQRQDVALHRRKVIPQGRRPPETDGQPGTQHEGQLRPYVLRRRMPSVSPRLRQCQQHKIPQAVRAVGLPHAKDMHFRELAPGQGGVYALKQTGIQAFGRTDDIMSTRRAPGTSHVPSAK